MRYCGKAWSALPPDVPVFDGFVSPAADHHSRAFADTVDPQLHGLNSGGEQMYLIDRWTRVLYDGVQYCMSILCSA